MVKSSDQNKYIYKRANGWKAAQNLREGRTFVTPVPGVEAYEMLATCMTRCLPVAQPQAKIKLDGGVIPKP